MPPKLKCIHSEAIHFDKFLYLLYVFGQIDPNKNSVDLKQTPQNAASDQGLQCLPLIQQYYTHS